jgi:hypothetical protein
MENDVAGSLEAIKNFYLFDYEEAISRPWVKYCLIVSV